MHGAIQRVTGPLPNIGIGLDSSLEAVTDSDPEEGWNKRRTVMNAIAVTQLDLYPGLDLEMAFPHDIAAIGNPGPIRIGIIIIVCRDGGRSLKQASAGKYCRKQRAPILKIPLSVPS